MYYNSQFIIIMVITSVILECQ